jgi:hypothetical protein
MRVAVTTVTRAVFNVWRFLTMATVASCGLLILQGTVMDRCAYVPEHDRNVPDGLSPREREIAGSSVCYDADGNVYLVKTGHRYETYKVLNSDQETIQSGENVPIPLPLLNFSHCQPYWMNELAAGKLHMSVWRTPVLGLDLCGEIPDTHSHSRRIFLRWDAHRQVWALARPHEKPFAYVSRNGRTQTPSRSDRFGRLRWGTVTPPGNACAAHLTLVTDHAAFDVDLAALTTTPLFEDQARGIRHVTASGWHRALFREHPSTSHRALLRLRTDDGRDHLVLRSPREHIVVEPRDTTGRLLYGEYAATPDGVLFLHREGDLRLPAGQGLLAFGSGYLHARQLPWNTAETLYRVASDGTLSRIASFTWKQPAQSMARYLPRRVCAHSSLVTAFSPLLYRPLYHVALTWWAKGDFYHRVQGRARPYPFAESVAEMLALVHPFHAGWAALITGLAAAFVAIHARRWRLGIGRTLFWLAVVGVFNVVGALTYLCLCRRPAPTCVRTGQPLGNSPFARPVLPPTQPGAHP